MESDGLRLGPAPGDAAPIRPAGGEPEVRSALALLGAHGFHVTDDERIGRAAFGGCVLEFWREPHNLGKAYATAPGHPALQRAVNEVVRRHGGTIGDVWSSIDALRIDPALIEDLKAAVTAVSPGADPR